MKMINELEHPGDQEPEDELCLSRYLKPDWTLSLKKFCLPSGEPKQILSTQLTLLGSS